MSLRFQAKVAHKQQLHDHLYLLELSVPEDRDFQFIPGQFMSLAVEGMLRRSYSLANTPDDNKLMRTYIDTIPAGPGSRFAERVEVDETVDVLAPLGHFIYIEEKVRPAYFFATGTGIVPFLSMIKQELVNLRSGREVNLHYGVRYQEEFIELDNLRAWEQEFTNFNLQLYVSRSTEWEGNKGRMTEYIQQGIPDNADAYLCGGINMIQDVENLLLEQGVNGDNIYYERFY